MRQWLQSERQEWATRCVQQSWSSRGKNEKDATKSIKDKPATKDEKQSQPKNKQACDKASAKIRATTASDERLRQEHGEGQRRQQATNTRGTETKVSSEGEGEGGEGGRPSILWSHCYECCRTCCKHSPISFRLSFDFHLVAFFKPFIFIFGLPNDIYSDTGTQFVGSGKRKK